MEKIRNTKAGKRYPGMIVPDHFFADFQAEMEREIDRYEAGKRTSRIAGRTGRQCSIGRRLMLLSSVAACVCLLIGLFPLMRSVIDDGSRDSAAAVAESGVSDLQYQEVQDMILAAVSDYDIYMDYYYEE